MNANSKKRKSFILRRNRSGAAIAEGAAALTLLLPIIILVVFAAVEISYLYVLKSSMVEAAREAARNLAIAYGQDPSIAESRATQDTKVFERIHIPNVIHDPRQFDNPVFATNVEPPTVTVTVRYAGSNYGLPPFPNPDPLNLGANYLISSTSTYRLQ